MTWSSAYDVRVDPSLDTERHRFSSKFRVRGRDETHCRLVFLPFYGTYINMREGMNSVFKHPGTLKGDVWTGELYRVLACMILDSLMRAWCIFLHFCPGGSCCRSHHWWRILRHPADLCHTFPVPESACTECKRNSDFWKVVGQFRFFFRHCFEWIPLSAMSWVFDGPSNSLALHCAGGSTPWNREFVWRAFLQEGAAPPFKLHSYLAVAEQFGGNHDHHSQAFEDRSCCWSG